MNKKLLNILLLSIGVTIFGLLMDDDNKEPNTIMRFVEFFAMIAIIFTVFTAVYYVINFKMKKVVFSKK
jgi:uncharacterized membrane protein YwaF